MFRIDRSRVKISDPCSVEISREIQDKSETSAEELAARREEENEISRGMAEKLAEEITSDARRQAEVIEVQAALLADQAKHDSELLKSEAMAIGYEEGLAKAEADYMKFVKENDNALNRVLTEIERGRSEMFKEMEAEMIDLCFAVIKKIATMDRERDGEIFKSIIRKVLNQMDTTSKFTIRLSDEDFERFFPGGEATFAVGDSQVTVAVVADPELQGGDIIAESENETVAAGVDVQIKNIELAFRRGLGKTNE